jgi:predicted ATPase
VVEEAATDLIALAQAQGIGEPWTQPSFIDSVAALQKQRQMGAALQADGIQFHDRSAVCTAALATYLGFPISGGLARELQRIQEEAVFQKQVLFVRNLGAIQPTEARRITFKEALRFEQIHEETYRSFGFELLFVEAGNLPERVAAIKTALKISQQEPS